MTTNQNIPVLRFPEFGGEWKIHNLGDIAKFSKGKGISKADIEMDGINECIRYGELYTQYSEVIKEVVSKTNIPLSELVISSENDVIIPASGETTLDIAKASCVMKSGVALGGDLNIIKTVHNGVFLSYYLNSKKKLDIASMAQGISVVHLYSSQLSLLNLNLCSLPEQQKIASFLTAVDEKIQQLTSKKALLEQYKKGVMQQLFSREIRFRPALSDLPRAESRGVEGPENGEDYPEWEERTLGDIGEVKMCRRVFNEQTSPDGEIPFYKIGSFGKKADAFISRELYFDYRERFSFPKKGDILISAAGTIGRLVVYDGEEAYYQDSNIVWIENDNTIILNQFLYFALQLAKFNTEGGTIQRLYNSILKAKRIDCPSLPEQQKIATFLSALDEKIGQVGQQLEQAKGWKKGLLQGMFV